MNIGFLIPVGIVLTCATGDGWHVIFIQALGVALIGVPVYFWRKNDEY